MFAIEYVQVGATPGRARRRARHTATAAIVALSAFLLATAHLAAQTPTQVNARSASRDSITVSLQDARRLAIRQGPIYLAAREEVAAARGGLRQARVHPFNPDLSVLTPGGGLGSEVTVTQELEVAGQRGFRVGAARFGVDRSEAGARDVARLTLADVSSAYYRALAARRRLTVAEQLLTLSNRLLQAVRVQAREGEISVMETNLAEIEAARARARLLATRREAYGATVELRRLIGIDPAADIRLVDDTSTSIPVDRLAVPTALDSLTRLALSRRPDLAAAAAGVRAAEAEVGLARRSALPNLRVGVSAERADDGGAGVRGVLGVGLPLLNRNQGVVDQRRAEARRAQYEARAAELRVRADVADALRAYQSATEEASVFAASVLEPARENSARLETAYRAGKIALPTLLLLRNQLLDAELGYWDAWLARREALVRLEAAVGTLTPDEHDGTADSATTQTTNTRTPR